MLILVTNDDGIAAAGIKSLANSLKRIGDVAVVAPERERSAVGHAITMHKPLRAKPVGYFGDRTKAWAVNGTPADCVKLGVEALLDKARPCILGYKQGTQPWYRCSVLRDRIRRNRGGYAGGTIGGVVAGFL